MFFPCECCFWSGRGPCDAPITRPEESYRVWCVNVLSRNLGKKEILPTGAVEPLVGKIFLDYKRDNDCH